MKFDRRGMLAAGGALAASACVPLQAGLGGRLSAKLRIIEANAGGTLGAYLLDVASGLSTGYRQSERFPHCSSFKTTLAALVLEKIAAGDLDGTATVRWSESDLLSYAPFAKERLATGATLVELARAAQTLSDNTAANLLLARVGGPTGVTAYWRALGDTVSRLDRTEPMLNHVPPGEEMDTTTPQAMAHTLRRLLYGDSLRPENRALLRQWMAETQTGARRVRAGLPAGWSAGDKTGNSGGWPGMGNAAADIGWAESPAGGRFTFAAYYRAAETVEDGNPPGVEEVFRQVGGVLADFAAVQTL